MYSFDIVKTNKPNRAIINVNKDGKNEFSFNYNPNHKPSVVEARQMLGTYDVIHFRNKPIETNSELTMILAFMGE
jgi:hypothetical protein